MTPGIIHGWNHIFNGNGAEVGDLHVINAPPYIISEWVPSEEERAAIAGGRNIMVSVIARGLPPFGLGIVPPVCRICEQAIKSGDDAAQSEGVWMHRICIDITMAGKSSEEVEAMQREALEKDLEAALRDDPEHIEIRPGVWARREDIAKCFDELKAERAALDAIGRALFAAPDHGRDFAPEAVVEVARLLLERNPRIVRAIADEVIIRRTEPGEGIQRPA